MGTASSTPNIAFIKYWGNRNNELRLPAADSLSMTLDFPTVEVTTEAADIFTVDSEKELLPKEIERFRKHWQLTNHYLRSMNVELSIVNCQLSIVSHIPPAIGLASSAAVFSAIAKAYAEMLKPEISLSDEHISVIARLGSGSAARNIYGGFVALKSATGTATQIADENHWPLHDIVIAPSIQEKMVGSPEGHALANTSPLFKNRLQKIPRRMQECTDAILNKDFEKLSSVSEEDCLEMHRVMQTSHPPLNYLSSETHRIVREITELRKSEHLAVFHTMDAGPTVHLVCTEDAVRSIKDFAHAQKDCTVFETRVGSGTHCTHEPAPSLP